MDGRDANLKRTGFFKVNKRSDHDGIYSPREDDDSFIRNKNEIRLLGVKLDPVETRTHDGKPIISYQSARRAKGHSRR